MKKNILIATTLALAGLPGLLANTAPTVVIHSAAMRPGTTLMDIVFRVNDPDDATVKTRALAFKDGVRSFANVIKPTTFVEGTGIKIGDAIPANANHTITWDVAADWDVQLGQVKFEVLAMDTNLFFPIQWVEIPATQNSSKLIVSDKPPTESQLVNAFYWLLASGDESIALATENNGISPYSSVLVGYIYGVSASTEYSGKTLIQEYVSSAGVKGFYLNSLTYKFIASSMGLIIPSPAEASVMFSSRVAPSGSSATRHIVSPLSGQ